MRRLSDTFVLIAHHTEGTVIEINCECELVAEVNSIRYLRVIVVEIYRGEIISTKLKRSWENIYKII